MFIISQIQECFVSLRFSCAVLSFGKQPFQLFKKEDTSLKYSPLDVLFLVFQAIQSLMKQQLLLTRAVQKTREQFSCLVKLWRALFSSRPYDYERIADMHAFNAARNACVVVIFCTFDRRVLQVKFYSFWVYIAQTYRRICVVQQMHLRPLMIRSYCIQSDNE